MQTVPRLRHCVARACFAAARRGVAPGRLPCHAAAQQHAAWLCAALSWRHVATTRCAAAAGDNLPATFVAPSTVDLADYPPPKRRLSKGTFVKQQALLAADSHTDDVVTQFVRSGGAGGQNVNKVNTKADIRFDVLAADWIPDWVKENLMEQEKNRMNNEGELVVNSSRHRTQKQNYEDALEKMQVMIDTAAKPPTGPSEETIKKVKTLAKKANQKRLDEKKRDSCRKAERRSRDFD